MRRLLLLLFLCGCAHNPIPGIDQYENKGQPSDKRVSLPLPPLPTQPLSSTRRMPMVEANVKVATNLSAQAPQAAQAFIPFILAFTNTDFWTPENHATIVVGTTNFSDWYPVAQVPYKEGYVTITLTNQLPFEFFNVYNQ